MPSATRMGMNTSCLTPSWTLDRIPMWPSLGTIRSRLLMARTLSHALPEGGSCVVNGRTAVLLGRSYTTSRSCTLFRLLSLHLPRALPMNQPSTGGCHGSSRRKTRLSPWLSIEALNTTSGPICLGLSSPKLWKRLTRSPNPLVLPFGAMQSNWK